MAVGSISNFKSIFLVKKAHLAFRRPNEHSAWFLTDLSIIVEYYLFIAVTIIKFFHTK